MEIWLKNMAHIEAHNFEYAMGKHTYSLGMNHYGDMTSEEFVKIHNGFLHQEHKKRGFQGGEPYLDHMNENIELPKEVDWRTEGLVTEVKDQGKSCLKVS